MSGGIQQGNGAEHLALPVVRSLILPAAVREQILLHLLAAAPNEGVGLLAVQGDSELTASDGAATGQRFFPGTNVDASPTRFTMDPAEVLGALREIDAHGWRLGAIVHSHLTGPATPSRTDLREAHYPDALLVIVSFARQPASMRAWRVDREDDVQVVRAVPLQIRRPE